MRSQVRKCGTEEFNMTLYYWDNSVRILKTTNFSTQPIMGLLAHIGRIKVYSSNLVLVDSI